MSSRLCLLTRNLCLSSNAKQLLPRSGCAKVLQSRGYCQGALQTNSANQALDCRAARWKVKWSSQATIPKKLCKRDSSKKHAAKQVLLPRFLSQPLSGGGEVDHYASINCITPSWSNYPARTYCPAQSNLPNCMPNKEPEPPYTADGRNPSRTTKRIYVGD